jgi:hypothetical protein
MDSASGNRRVASLPPMRRAALLLAAVVLLLGPTVLAFFAGGYFDGPRSAAGAVAWALVLLLVLAGAAPVPASRSGGVALAGLVGLAVWSGVSLAWAPLGDPAGESVQRLLIYAAALLASVALLRDRRFARAVEPVLALGGLIVIGYGLAGRLVPGTVDLIRSIKAGGRLEQPITYWNAEGLLAAMGLILCVRVAGDSSRATAMRVAAAAACAPLGLGVYLSYSRGAVVVAVMGLLILLAAEPSRSQLRAGILGLSAAVLTSACSAAFRGVASLEGSPADQRRDGAIMLGILVMAMLISALVTSRGVRAERRDSARVGTLRGARRLPAVVGVGVLLCVAGLVIGGLAERGDQKERTKASASRFTSVSSRRFEYWRVGAAAFVENPVKGVGAGGYRVVWRKERHVNEGVQEVHSLVLEMATELGVVGLVLLALLLGGVAAAGRHALRAGAPVAAGACAACSAWLMHALIDWDLQLPAVTLPAVVLAGALLAASELRAAEPAPEPVA